MLFFCLFGNCNNAKETSKMPQTHETIAKEFIQTQGVNIPVYDFEGFAPYLQAPNEDTLYIINFWATWCAPCVAELPHFFNAAKVFANQPLKMIFVSLDLKKDYETKLAKFVKERFDNHTVVALNAPNANAWIEQVDKNWDGAIPVTLFYKGAKRSFYATELEEAQLIKIIEPFIL